MAPKLPVLVTKVIPHAARFLLVSGWAIIIDGMSARTPTSREPSSNAKAMRLRQSVSRQQRLRLTQPVPPPPSATPEWLLLVKRGLASLLRRIDWAKVTSLATALAAVSALYFSAKSLQSTEHQYSLSEQGQQSERFTKSIEQLGSDKSDVRLGGIYSLAQLAQDSASDRPVVFHVLSAYVRDHSGRSGTGCAEPNVPGVEIDAVLGAMKRRDIPPFSIDLRRACLHGRDLSGTILTLSSLQEIDISQTILTDSDMSYSELVVADLDGAFAFNANFTDADLEGASLVGAMLSDANLTHANLNGTNLTGARLQDANLHDICYDKFTRWPERFTPPPSRPNAGPYCIY